MCRSASIIRRRRSLDLVVRDLSPREFQRAFRMNRDVFNKLLSLLLTDLNRDRKQGLRSSGGCVDPDVRLAITLRLLAGASYLDIMMLFGLSVSSVYAVFHATNDSIMSRLSLPGLPLSDTNALDILCGEFTASRSRVNPLSGCVGALDGIAIKIKKPKNCYIPRNYYCRKGNYAMPFQAIVDARYRFLTLSSVVCGSTHDSLAFNASALGIHLKEHGLPTGYWIAADAAYMCTESLLVPFSSVQLLDSDEGTWRDSFNFFQSSLRVHVEQAFGVLVNRFGILWRPICYDLCHASRVVCSCALLHNFIIDNTNTLQEDEDAGGDISPSVTERRCTTEAFRRWWRESQTQRRGSGSGTRSDLARSTHRDLLTVRVKDLGLTRPPTSS